ncbi:hypothetical protein BKA65DRAFT_541191 [Rhexocercosporidium sp. MPI-PUGE-AT-0058]|nr:hypothetical protein BKA65DRAFT_541191 [Rhexocercosporidium sp. MPI-PUGE-AT-0058]
MSSSIPTEFVPYFTGEKTDDSSLESAIININSIFISLIICTTGLRFWVRFHMLRSGGLDDILLLVAVIFSVFLSASALVGESFGLGRHVWNLGSGSPTSILTSLSKVVKSLYGCYLAYTTSITFTKLSIISTYVRFLPKGLARKINFGLGIIILLFWISSIFAIIFQCVPAQSAWDYSVKGECYSIKNLFFALSTFNVITDILLCILPIPLLWSLKMPKAQRAVLCLLFCMGTFASVASILRITHLDHLDSLDISFKTVEPMNWSIVEADVGIICVALSALRPLVKRIVPNHFQQNSRISTPASCETLQTTTIFTFKSRTLQLNAMVQNPPLARKGSVVSSRSEIFVQRSFEVKDLPATPTAVKELPPLPDKIQLPVIPPMVHQKECGRHSVVGMFTVDFLDTTSAEDSDEYTVEDDSLTDEEYVFEEDETIPEEDIRRAEGSTDFGCVSGKDEARGRNRRRMRTIHRQ